MALVISVGRKMSQKTQMWERGLQRGGKDLGSGRKKESVGMRGMGVHYRHMRVIGKEQTYDNGNHFNISRSSMTTTEEVLIHFNSRSQTASYLQDHVGMDLPTGFRVGSGTD